MLKWDFKILLGFKQEMLDAAAAQMVLWCVNTRVSSVFSGH